MCRTIIFIMAMSVFIIPETQAESANSADNDDTLKITVTSLDISDKALNLVYEIRNDSKQEVWICDDILLGNVTDFEVLLSEDKQLLTIRRRLDVPHSPGLLWYRRPRGKYVRLHPGEKQNENLSVNGVLEGICIFDHRRSEHIPRSCIYVPRLAIEIGYFVGNLPEKIFNIIEQTENTYNSDSGTVSQILNTFGGTLSFNYFLEQLRNRDEEIVIPYTYQQIRGEKILRTVINELHIPYQKRKGPRKEDRHRYDRPDFGPDISTCTKLEIRYKPSALEYVFPFTINQNLLSDEEAEYLRSENTFVIEDQNILKSFAKKVKRGTPFYGIVREDKIAHFDCYHNNDHLTSFTTYGNMIVETEGKERLSYTAGLMNIGTLSPEIQKLEYRVLCAINLRISITDCDSIMSLWQDARRNHP